MTTSVQATNISQLVSGVLVLTLTEPILHQCPVILQTEVNSCPVRPLRCPSTITIKYEVLSIAYGALHLLFLDYCSGFIFTPLLIILYSPSISLLGLKACYSIWLPGWPSHFIHVSAQRSHGRRGLRWPCSKMALK